MKTIAKHLVLTVALCISAYASFGFYEVRSYLQSYTAGPHGDPCATILVTLWEVYTNDAGTTTQRLIGAGACKIGDYGDVAPRPGCNDPIPIDSGLMVTDPISPVCISDALALPGMFDMAVASIDSAMSGFALRPAGVSAQPNNLTTLALTMFPSPASSFITVTTTLSGAHGAFLVIYDAAGKQVRTRRFDSQVNNDHFIMDVSSMPRGTYIAVLRGENGQSIRTQFVLK